MKKSWIKNKFVWVVIAIVLLSIMTGVIYVSTTVYHPSDWEYDTISFSCEAGSDLQSDNPCCCNIKRQTFILDPPRKIIEVSGEMILWSMHFEGHQETVYLDFEIGGVWTQVAEFTLTTSGDYIKTWEPYAYYFTPPWHDPPLVSAFRFRADDMNGDWWGKFIDGVHGNVYVVKETPPPQNNPPVQPSNPNPANGATSVDHSSITLHWSCSDPDGDPLTYDVYFGTSPTPSLYAQGVSGLQYHVGILQKATTYYWEIAASDGEDSTYGPIWCFTADTDTPPPGNEAPEITGDSGNLNLKAGEYATIWVKATDDKGISSAILSINGAQTGQLGYDVLDARWEYTYMAPDSGNSQLSYVVTVYDEETLSDSISRTINVDFTQHSTIIDQIKQLVTEYWQYILIGLAILLIIVLLARRRR